MQDNGSLPLVVISLLHWNTLDCTMRCLDSLAALDYTNFQIVLIDNASADDSVDLIRRRYPELRILCNSTNVGFAGGHATALAYAKAQGAAALWLINSDCITQPAALSALVTAWRTIGAGIFGSVPLRSEKDGRQVVNFPSRFLQSRLRWPVLMREQPISMETVGRFDPFEVCAVPGSGMLIPLSVVESSGWMQADWFLYCEELDYCLRLRHLNVRSFLVPRSVIEHPGGGSHRDRPHVADCIVYYQTRNEIVLARRHSGPCTACLTGFKKVLRAAACVFVRPARASKMLLGIFHALRGRMGRTLAPETALVRDLSDANERVRP